MRRCLALGSTALPLLLAVTLLSGCAGTKVTASSDQALPSPAASSATPTPTPSPDLPVSPAPSNLALSEAAGAIAEVVTADREDVAAEGFTGYSGIEINNELGVVDLFWKGKVPKRVLKIIESYSKITTRIHASTLTLDDAEKAKHAVLDWAQTEGAVDGQAMIASIGTLDDYSGVDVAVVERDGPIDLETLKATLIELTGVPVEVSVMSVDDIPVAS